MLGAEECERLRGVLSRYGSYVLVMCRPVPVLAEASVLVAGATGLPLRTAMAATSLSNLGVAGAYAALGALSHDPVSFLVVFAATCILPALAWTVAQIVRRVRAVDR